jgi:uncharacterized protein YbaP (TraB family)
VLIDGSVLANAPFRPAIDALRDRPARREVDRRFVYIDPKPGHRSISLARDRKELPGFFTTILAAMSDIPREQPIRDNLETIEGRSHRIRRMQAIVEAIQPEVETEIEASLGRTFFLDRPNPARLRAWRAKAQDLAARKAGFSYASYGHLKLSGIIDEIAETLTGLAGESTLRRPIREALWQVAQEDGLTAPGACSSKGASEAVILFFRQHDLGFRIRRLRSLTRLVSAIGDTGDVPADQLQPAHEAAYHALAPYLDRQMHDFYDSALVAAARDAAADPRRALALLGDARNLKLTDDLADDLLADALAALPKAERRRVLFAYLGFPFYDIATLPLLHGEGHDEFDEVKVDRISPDDATAIRSGGAEATLKGIRFNSFGAFFSRAYRENDYLWGRLHGVDRLIDIEAMDDSDRLVLEVVGLEQSAEITKTFQQLGNSPGQPPLADRLPPELRERAETLRAASRLAPARFETLESWAAALSLAGAATANLAMLREEGVERVLAARYRRQSKPVIGLETPARQFGYFDALAESDQRAMLESVVADADNAPKAYRDMVTAWLKGDGETLAEAANRGLLQRPQIREQILVRRNRDWADQITDLLSLGANPFIAVGAAHLAGEDSVQAMLEARGFTVTRLQ